MATDIPSLEGRGVTVVVRDDDHGDTLETATTIALGDRADGIFEFGHDVDVFRVEVPVTSDTTSYAVQTVLNPSVVVDIPDADLRHVVEHALGWAPGKTITALEMASITTLDASKLGIANLAGLEFAAGLVSLSLWGNRISDLSPLSTLTGLNGLNLAGNAIADLSALAGLTRLTSLNLGGNEISDLSPLAGLVSLTELRLYDNRIVDLSPLAGLIGLTELSLRGNEIEDVAPLAAVANLNVLLLANNRIADISPLLDNPGLAEGDRPRRPGEQSSRHGIGRHPRRRSGGTRHRGPAWRPGEKPGRDVSHGCGCPPARVRAHREPLRTGRRNPHRGNGRHRSPYGPPDAGCCR